MDYTAKLTEAVIDLFKERFDLDLDDNDITPEDGNSVFVDTIDFDLNRLDDYKGTEFDLSAEFMNDGRADYLRVTGNFTCEDFDIGD